MPGNREIFVDTNILIYYTNPQLPQHNSAVGLLNSLRQSGVQLVISPQVLREYLAANTKFVSAGQSITLNKIRENFVLFQSEFRVVDDNRPVLEALNGLLQQIPLAGKQIYDANLVATMQAYGIQTLLTNNAGDFTKFASHITVIDLAPSQVGDP